jgi:hypothetical protein
MPQRDNKRNVVEGGKAKPREIDRANDPEPFFELEPGRAHGCICSGCCSPLQSAAVPSVGRHNEPIPFAVLEHRVGAPGLFLRRAFKFHAALFQFGIRFVNGIAHVRHVHE